MAERVEVLGLDKVLKNMKGLDGELKRKALLSGSRKGVNKFKRGTFSHPRFPKKRSGSLKAGFTTRQMSKTLAAQKDIVGAMLIIKTKLSKAQRKRIGEASKDPWYWFLHEYGWNAGGRWRKYLGKKTKRGYNGPKLKSNRGLTRDAFRAKSRKTGTPVKERKFVQGAFDKDKRRVANEYASEIAKGVDNYRGS